MLRGFDAHLAAQRVAFTYSHAELRQACTFVVRQLDAQDKHWLAQDGGELFSVSGVGVGGALCSCMGC